MAFSAPSVHKRKRDEEEQRVQQGVHLGRAAQIRLHNQLRERAAWAVANELPQPVAGETVSFLYSTVTAPVITEWRQGIVTVVTPYTPLSVRSGQFCAERLTLYWGSITNRPVSGPWWMTAPASAAAKAAAEAEQARVLEEQEAARVQAEQATGRLWAASRRLWVAAAKAWAKVEQERLAAEQVHISPAACILAHPGSRRS